MYQIYDDALDSKEIKYINHVILGNGRCEGTNMHYKPTVLWST